MILAPRHLPRLASMVGLFTRYGLRDFARQQGLLALAPDQESTEESAVDGDGVPIAERAAAFRHRLVELGPAYVKLGQVLSTRPDLIPEPYIQELEKLQDDVDTVSFAEIEATIQEELGARISKLFAEFDHEPLAAASLGQAHAATLRDGREVVVKVQRPHIRASLAEDIDFFREVAGFLARHTEAGVRVDLVGVIEQLERALADELDYRIEARNAMAIRRSLAEFPRILIPRVIEGYTTQRVLTVERIRGVSVDEISPLTRLEHDLHLVADEFAKGYLKQVVIDGHFHADPHPGNVFLVLPGTRNPRTPAELASAERRRERRDAATPLARVEQEARQEAAPAAPDDEPRLALIDFGMTARLSPETRDRMVRLLLDLAENRGESVGQTLIELGEPTTAFDRAAFVRETAALVAHHHDRTVGDLQTGTVLFRAIGIAFTRGLRLPSQLSLLAKALFSLDAVTRSLDATYDPNAAIRSYAAEIIESRARRELSPQRLFETVARTTELVRELPHRVDLITARLAANDLALRVDSPQLGRLLDGMQKIANRIFSGLVLAALLVASAMLLPVRPRLGTTGFTVAAVIGVYMVATILISDRRRSG